MGICLFFPNTTPPRPPCYTVSKWKSKANLTPLYFFLKQSNIHVSLCSVQFSHSVVSNSLWPHGLQHARPPCPSPIPGACSNSCSLSRWCHPTLSSSVIFASCLQSFLASGSFPMSQFFTSGDQSIGASASASVLPMNSQGSPSSRGNHFYYETQ